MSGKGRCKGHRCAFAAEVLAIVAVPVVLAACVVSGFEQTALLSLAVVLVSLGMFFAGFEGARPRMRDVMPTVVLAALAAAGRILFAPFPDFKPVSAIAIIAGVAFGRRSGFMVGALAALASNFFFGQGPWTPWQMYAWGLMGYLAGALAQTGLFDGAIAHSDTGEKAASSQLRRVITASPLYLYGFISRPLYGVILTPWS
ncbi:ECF transporter S component, partial [uncultured Slackia sp.]|uniref:ECF transporter S component n=1 Tax=uncultured Slackia sp. TaxID=665903 RepID=UPI0025EE0265